MLLQNKKPKVATPLVRAASTGLRVHPQTLVNYNSYKFGKKVPVLARMVYVSARLVRVPAILVRVPASLASVRASSKQFAQTFKDLHEG